MTAVIDIEPLKIVGDGDLVEVRANGRRLTGWTAAEIAGAIDEATSTWSITTSGVFDPTKIPLQGGDLVEVLVGPDLVATGYVDRVAVRCSRDEVTLTYSGRSKTCDAVDCSAPLGARAGKRLAAVVADMVADYALDVIDEAGVGGEIVPRSRPQDGESVFEVLERVGRERGFLVTDDALGRLVLTRAGAAGKASTPIVYGTPGVLESDCAWDMSERYSHYEVRGQIATDAEVDPSVVGGAADRAVLRFRRLVIKPEKPVDTAGARRWAAWEATTRAGKSFAGTYTIRGWRQENSGELWAKNLLVDVVDHRNGLFGPELLIVGVTLTIDKDGGRIAVLRVGAAAGFEPPPRQSVAIGDTGAFVDELESTDPASGDGE